MSQGDSVTERPDGQQLRVEENIEQRLRLWADELRAIANDGLHWSVDNPYDHHRYQRIQRLAAAMFAVQDLRDLAAIERVYQEDLGHIAPYPSGDAAVFDSEGRILLIQRKDNALWAMPGGAIEVGETPAEGVCREAWEETGVLVEPVALSGIYDSRFWQARSAFQLYQFVFLCRPHDPAQQPHVSNETLDVRWYREADLEELALDPNHGHRIAHAFKRWRGELRETIFDMPAR